MKYIVLCSFLMCARGLKIDAEHRAEGDIPSPKYRCAFDSNDTKSLDDYRRLFKRWSGQTVMFAGDSIAFQMFNVIRCGAGALGWKHDVEEQAVYYHHHGGFVKRPCAAEYLPVEQVTAEEIWDGQNGVVKVRPGSHQGVLTKSSIRPHGESSMQEAVVLYMYFFYKFKLDVNYRDSEPLSRAIFADSEEAKYYYETKPATLIDVFTSVPADHIFTNLGHHAIDARSHLEQEIDKVFHILNDGIWAAERSNRHTRPTLTILSHPPQHFNNPTGEFLVGRTNAAQPCSNDVRDIHNQLAMKNNRIKERKSVEYGHGFASIDFSESMIPYGNMHIPEYGDCTHYVLSPVAWAGAINRLVTA